MVSISQASFRTRIRNFFYKESESKYIGFGGHVKSVAPTKLWLLEWKQPQNQWMNGHSCVPIKLDLQNRWLVWFGLRVKDCQPLIQRITCDSAKDSKVFVTELTDKYYCHPHPFPYWHRSSAFGHMDCSPPGFSVHGISQTRVLEWVAISFSRGPSQPRDQTCISCIGRWILYHWTTREALNRWIQNYEYNWAQK